MADTQAPQILLCGSTSRYEFASRAYKLRAVYVNGEWPEIEGARVVCLDAHLAPLALLEGASEIKYIDPPLPEEGTDDELKEWIKKHAKIYAASTDSAPAETPAPALPSPAGITPRQGAEPVPNIDARSDEDAARVFNGAFEAIYTSEAPPPFPDDEEAPTERPSQSWEHPQADWPLAPVDFWQQGKAIPVIDARLLPPAIAEYVLDQADLRGVDAAQVALNAIVALSGALHNGIGIRPYAGEGKYIERPILWGAVVGNSSTKKGAAQDIVMGRLRERDLEMRRQAATRMQARRDDQQVYEARLAGWVRDSAKGSPAGSRPEPPEPVDQDRLLVENFTMEGLRSVLEFNGRGKVFGCFDEIASLFGNLDAFSAQKGATKDAPQLLKLYESKPGMFDRAAPAPPIYIKSFAASICGGIQPGTLQRIVAKLDMTENGMLQRFMLVIAKPARIPERRPANYEAQMRWDHLIDALVDMKPHFEPCAFGADASAVHDDFVRWVYAATAACSNDGLASAVGKYDGLFSRLCLVYHCAKCADAGAETPSLEVSGETAAQVSMFIREFLFPHTQSFYADLEMGAPTYHPMRQIAALILAQGLTDLTTTTLWRSWSGWRKMDLRARREVLTGLQESGWLRKRSETMFTVHPEAHVIYEEQAAESRAKREEYARIFEAKKAAAREPGAD